MNSEIDLGKINERVFTVNNHYLSHLPYLIKAMGPLKCYSCRPMERTIKKFTNLIKSTSKIGANASNVLKRQANYNKMAVRHLELIQFPEIADLPSSYKVHFSGVQLWAPFESQSLLGSEFDLICYGIRRKKVVGALKSFYARLTENRNVTLSCFSIEIASRAWYDDLVYSSKMDRQLKRLVTRANNIILFEVTKNTGKR